jgi:hypothetical protein
MPPQAAPHLSSISHGNAIMSGHNGLCAATGRCAPDRARVSLGNVELCPVQPRSHELCLATVLLTTQLFTLHVFRRHRTLQCNRKRTHKSVCAPPERSPDARSPPCALHLAESSRQRIICIVSTGRRERNGAVHGEALCKRLASYCSPRSCPLTPCKVQLYPLTLVLSSAPAWGHATLWRWAQLHLAQAGCRTHRCNDSTLRTRQSVTMPRPDRRLYRCGGGRASARFSGALPYAHASRRLHHDSCSVVVTPLDIIRHARCAFTSCTRVFRCMHAMPHHHACMHCVSY